MEALEYDGLRVYFKTVGPESAKELLSSYNIDYRKLRPTYADGLARDMSPNHIGCCGNDAPHSHWRFDGSPIRIDEEDNLFDGQHRLTAVTLSQTEQTFLFIEGLPVSAYDTTDTGLARNFGDTLRRRGYKNVDQRTALIKSIGRWESGRSLGDTKAFRPLELDAIHDKYVDSINRIVGLVVGSSKKVDMPAAAFAFCWWILHQINPEQAYTFMVQLIEGEELKRGMPVFHLRNRLRMERDTKLSRTDYAHLVFQAWNAVRKDEEKTRFVLPNGPGGTTRENLEMPI